MLKALTNKLENLKNSIKRFPISYVLVLVITTLLFLWNNSSTYSDGTLGILEKSILSFTLVFFLSLWVYLSTEELKISNTKKSFYQLFPPAFWILFYLGLNISDIVFPLCLAWIISYVFFAPYIKKLLAISTKKLTIFGKTEEENEIYYQYFYKIAIVFIFGFVLGWLLFALWNLAILAFQLLFDLEWDLIDDFYSNWAIISLSFITPIVCLAEIPNENLILNKKFELNVFVTFIIKYILTSFIVIYFAILYAYSIKVLLNFSDWPKWEVVWLVIAFSVIGYITFILSYYFDNKVKFISIIRKVFPFVVIPQIFMLFYAIYLRIAQYDLTTNRYFVVIFGVWLLVISMYFVFSKKKNLVIIPAVLTLFTIIISVWPWSVYSLPITRQMARLETNLEKAWILVGWKIVPLNSYDDIDKDLSKEIYDGIHYICYNSNCENIRKLFSINDSSIGKWETINRISDNLKVKRYNTYDNWEKSFRISSEVWPFPMDIEWYSKLAEISSYNSTQVQAKTTNSEWINYSNLVNIDLENNTLQISNNGIIEENIDILPLINELYSIYTKNWEQAKKLVFDLSWTKYDLKLFILYAVLRNPNYTTYNEDLYTYINWYVLIKEK